MIMALKMTCLNCEKRVGIQWRNRKFPKKTENFILLIFKSFKLENTAWLKMLSPENYGISFKNQANNFSCTIITV